MFIVSDNEEHSLSKVQSAPCTALLLAIDKIRADHSNVSKLMIRSSRYGCSFLNVCDIVEKLYRAMVAAASSCRDDAVSNAEKILIDCILPESLKFVIVRSSHYTNKTAA